MDWLRSEDLKEEKNVTAPIAIIAVHALCRCHESRGVPLGMRRINPEYLDPDSSDRSVTADILLRQEPDEDDQEEKEDEGDDKEEDDDDDDEESDDGYSE
jgi:hypothetical protein